MEIKSKISPMIIGYWPIRLKAQVSRLVCQYLHLSYQDKFFDPLSWNHYKENEAKTWIFKDLPFLKDENFIVTGSLAMVTYICEKAEKRELFGKNLQDKVKIDNLCQKCDILMLAHATNWCSQKHGQIQRKQCLQSHWSKKIKPLLMIYEEECQLDSWFFSYPTVIDFIVYQIVNQIEAIYPKQIICFDKLRKLRQKVGKITQIEAYEKSQRAVKQCCPTYYFKSFKEQKINSLTQSSQTASQRSKGQ